jgi:hypothetical protein
MNKDNNKISIYIFNLVPSLLLVLRHKVLFLLLQIVWGSQFSSDDHHPYTKI